MAGQYPVVWGEKTFYLGDLTAAAKQAFCRWAIRWNGEQQIQTYGDLPHILNPLLASIPPLVWWADRGMSKLVAETLEHPDGNLFFNRLLFGDSVKLLSNTDLQKLVTAKEDEQTKANEKAAAAGAVPPFPPANDYFLAMNAIKENSDPKAVAAGTAPAAGTPTSAAS